MVFVSAKVLHPSSQNQTQTPEVGSKTYGTELFFLNCDKFDKSDRHYHIVAPSTEDHCFWLQENSEVHCRNRRLRYQSVTYCLRHGCLPLTCLVLSWGLLIFFPLIGRRNTPHTHNVACGSFGDLLHVTSCLHHLVHTLPRSSLFALINMLKCRRIVKREKAMQQWHASARLESLCSKKEVHIKSKKVIVDGSSYVEFECPAKKLQYPSTEAVH